MVDWSTTNIVYVSAEAVVGFITVTGNLIVLVAIIWTKSLHTITNVFIGNLAVADIAVGIFVAPCAALSFLGLPSNKYGCIFINCAILMFTNISILMLLTIAVERFIAIRFPFIYKRHATVKTAILVNLSIWVIGSILGLLPMLGWNKAPDDLSYCEFTAIISMEYMVYFQFFAITLTPLLIMLIIYLYIFSVVWHHTKQTRALERLFRDSQNSSRNRRRWDKDVQAAKMFALIFTTFGLFWLPINIMNSITLFCPTCKSPYELLLTTIVLSHANSSVNPFLYAANNSQIKLALKNMFSLRHPQENQLDSNSQGPVSSPDMENNQNGKEASRSIAPGENGVRHRDEQMNGAQFLNSSENTDSAIPNRTTKVSFVTEPYVIDATKGAKSNPAANERSFRETSHVLIQTHSFRDEIDNHILDRLTPLEGIMANIYNSLDSETRDIIENKGNCSDTNTQNIIQNPANIAKSQQNGNLSDDYHVKHSPPTSITGHVNYAFVEDNEIECGPKESVATEMISHIQIQEPDTHAISVHTETSLSHSNTNSKANRPLHTPKLLRSSNIQSTDVLSNSSSNDSSAIFASNKFLNETPASPEVENPVIPQSHSNQTHVFNSPNSQSTTIEHPNTVHRPTTLPDHHSTTQKLFMMESENDESIMSVKFFKDSQEARSNDDMTNTIESPFYNTAMLENHSTESTHL